MTINREEFDRVRRELEHGEPLNLRMIGNIFGQPFWELLLLCLVDSKVAYKELLELLEKNG